MSGADDHGRDRRTEPFHGGETAVHERYGIRERIEQVGRAVIRDAMPLQHRQFFAVQPMLFVGSLDGARRPWASVLAGPRGFIAARDATTLRVNALPEQGDPLSVNLAIGAPLGFLGIEFATRRRNRLNGTVEALDATGFTVRVDQSFGNCPQYIQARDVAWPSDPAGCRPDGSRAQTFARRLPDAALDIVRRADTLFLASAAAGATGAAGADGVDVSHRGGKPGFVRVTTGANGDVLTLPDFRGNFLFNTIGNLVSNPVAGILVVDFASGDLLQLTGTTEIVWEGAEVEAFAGAQRLVKFTIDEGIHRYAVLAARWSEPEYASQLEATGDWDKSASR